MSPCVCVLKNQEPFSTVAPLSLALFTNELCIGWKMREASASLPRALRMTPWAESLPLSSIIPQMNKLTRKRLIIRSVRTLDGALTEVCLKHIVLGAEFNCLSTVESLCYFSPTYVLSCNSRPISIFDHHLNVGNGDY